jgi:hypothetical protein
VGVPWGGDDEEEDEVKTEWTTAKYKPAQEITFSR